VVTGFGYDLLGRLRYVTNDFHAAGPNPFLTQYGYDEFGNLTTQTDAENHTTTFLYNKLGQRIRRTLPPVPPSPDKFEQFAYDAVGNQVKRTNFMGKVTTFEYDSLNRLLHKKPDESLGEPWVSFTYHLFGKRATMDDASGITTYLYDAQHRLEHRNNSKGNLFYIYGGSGRLSEILGRVQYTWNRLGQLAAVTNTVNGVSLGTTYNYDRVGNLQVVSNAKGVVVTGYAYDEMNRLRDETVNHAATPLARYIYDLRPEGNRYQVTELGGRIVNYGYDNLYRLTSEAITGPQSLIGTINYGYDHVGNRLSRTVTGSALANKVPSVNSVYDADDRLGGDSYDENGNTLRGQGGAAQTADDRYDFEDHLISRNNGEVQFIYDGDGNRVRKITTGVDRYYLIDDQNPTGYPQVLEEGTTAGADHTYVYGLSRLSQKQNGIISYYGYDGHGSVRLLTDSNGFVTDTYTYEAFGILIDQTGSTPNDFLFAGEQFDRDLGLYDDRARYLNVATGRFWTMDTFEGTEFDPLSLHKYLYCGSSPVDHVDPTGHGELLEKLEAAAITVGLFTARWVGRNPKKAFLFLSAISATGVFDGFPPGEITPVDELAAWGKVMRRAPAEAKEAVIWMKYQAPLLVRAFFSRASRKDYAETFFEAFPKLRGKVWVHHAVEQQALDKYPGLITEEELNSLANLRGIPNEINPQVHLRRIRRLWDNFYAKHPNGVKKEELLEYAKKIDDLLGDKFVPPIR